MSESYNIVILQTCLFEIITNENYHASNIYVYNLFN